MGKFVLFLRGQGRAWSDQEHSLSSHRIIEYWKLYQEKKTYHYENTPLQIYWKFYNQKKENFRIKNSDIFHIPAQNIDCGYSLDVSARRF